MTFFPPHNSMYVFIYLICVHFPRWFHPQISQKFRREMKTTENINLLQFRYTVRFLFLSLCRRRRCFFFLYFFYIGGNVTRRSISNARENEKKKQNDIKIRRLWCVCVFNVFNCTRHGVRVPKHHMQLSTWACWCGCVCVNVFRFWYRSMKI